jgi:histidinol phosphatase-like PHP family hydrolase
VGQWDYFFDIETWFQCNVKVQRDFPDLRIFHGIECDILPDGRLDLDARTLGALDYVIVSIHTLLDLDIAAMTRRVLEAIRHPAATILAHPSGRLFHQRPCSLSIDRTDSPDTHTPAKHRSALGGGPAIRFQSRSIFVRI